MKSKGKEKAQWGLGFFKVSRGDGVAFAEGGQHFDYGTHVFFIKGAGVFDHHL